MRYLSASDACSIQRISWPGVKRGILRQVAARLRLSLHLGQSVGVNRCHLVARLRRIEGRGTRHKALARNGRPVTSRDDPGQGGAIRLRPSGRAGSKAGEEIRTPDVQVGNWADMVCNARHGRRLRVAQTPRAPLVAPAVANVFLSSMLSAPVLPSVLRLLVVRPARRARAIRRERFS